MRSSLVPAVLFCVAGSTLAPTFAWAGPIDPPTPVVPSGNDPITGQPWQAPGAFPATVTAANFDVSLAPGTVLGANDNNGDQALKVFPIRSGPLAWTSGWTNEGDIDANISPAQPANADSFPPDQFIRLQNESGLRTYAWSINYFRGSVLMSTRANGRNNLDTVFGVPVGNLYGICHISADTFRSGNAYSMIDGTHRDGLGSAYLSMHYAGSFGNQEMSIDCAAAWFPWVEGWQGALIRPQVGPANDAVFITDDRGTPDTADDLVSSTPGMSTSVLTWNADPSLVGQQTLTLPGVNSNTDGVLLVSSFHDNNDPKTIAAVPNAAGGWDLTHRLTSTDTSGQTISGTNQCHTQFVYVPYSANNAIAARVNADGSIASSAGTFTLTRTGVGQYTLAIPGESDLTGSLMLVVSGKQPGSNLGHRAFLSYDSGPSNTFLIQSRVLVEDFVSGNAFDENAILEDAGFSFVWIDHESPISLGTACVGDFNGDGFVDDTDFVTFAAAYQAFTVPPADAIADLTGDGFVDDTDFVIFAAAYQAFTCE